MDHLLLDLVEGNDITTGQEYFDLILKLFKEYGIPITNLMAIITDGHSAMKGKNIGLVAKLREILPEIFDLTCICHSLANALKNAVQKHIPKFVIEFINKLGNHFADSH